jgi:hypothetical protein
MGKPMEITWILIFLFAFSTMVFVALAFFLPEWVGISKSRSDHSSESSKENKPPE